MSRKNDTNYMLLNPYVVGDQISKIHKSDTAIGSAKKAWEQLTRFITGKVDTFHITMQRTSDNSLHHFEIHEKEQKGGGVEFEINSYNPADNAKMTKNFLKTVSSAQSKGTQIAKARRAAKGGSKKKDIDDDSSSDSSSDFYKDKRNTKRLFVERQQPIYYWWYDPLIYGVDMLYFPTFMTPLMPSVEISLSSAPLLITA
jgi:hypothetical protein